MRNQLIKTVFMVLFIVLAGPCWAWAQGLYEVSNYHAEPDSVYRKQSAQIQRFNRRVQDFNRRFNRQDDRVEDSLDRRNILERRVQRARNQQNKVWQRFRNVTRRVTVDTR